MTDDTDAVTSTEQDAWCEIWSRLRDELAKQIPTVGAQTGTEAKALVDALGEAMTWHFRSKLFDHRVSTETARTVHWQE